MSEPHSYLQGKFKSSSQKQEDHQGDMGGYSLPPPIPLVQPPVQKKDHDEKDKEELQDDAEAIYEAFHGSIFYEDEEAALGRLRGRSPAQIKYIRQSYLSRYGRKLEIEFREYCNNAQFREALTFITPVLDLRDQIAIHIEYSHLLGKAIAKEKAILQLLSLAPQDQLAQARPDGSPIKRMLGLTLDEDDFYEALKIIQPDRMYDNVKWRIIHAEGFWDDETGVISVLLDLPSSERKKLFQQDRNVFHFVNGYVQEGNPEKGSNFDAVRIMCTGTEAQALKESMRYATEGIGTHNELLDKTLAKTQEAALREQELKKKQADGSASAAEKAELQQLGGIQENLLDLETIDGELKEGSFLEMARDDVSEDRFRQSISGMAVSPSDKVRMEIMELSSIWKNDPLPLLEAFAGIPDAGIRATVFGSQDVQQRIQDVFAYYPDVIKVLHAIVRGDDFQLKVYRARTYLKGISVDFDALAAEVGTWSEGERGRLKTDFPGLYNSLTGPYGRLWADQTRIMRELLNTGSFTSDAGLDYALGQEGVWDGTEKEFLFTTLEKMSVEERLIYRAGYLQSLGGKVPESVMSENEARAALSEFRSLRDRLEYDLGDDDYVKALDILIGVTTPKELESPEGRMMAAQIMAKKVNLKTEAEDGTFARGFTDIFSDSPENLDQATITFNAALMLAMQDQGISMTELAALGALEGNYDEAYGEYLNSVDQISGIAATVAAIAVAIAITAASMGAAGPACAAALSSLSTAQLAGVAAVSTGLAKVGTQELTAGSHFDTFSSEGAQVFVTGGIEGAMAVISAGLASRLASAFSSFVGKQGAALSQALFNTTINSTGSAVRSVGGRIAFYGLEGSIDGAISEAVAQLAMTAMDEATWKQGIYQTITAFGEQMIRSVGIGALTGGVMSAGMGVAGEGLGAMKQWDNADPDFRKNFAQGDNWLHPEDAIRMGHPTTHSKISSLDDGLKKKFVADFQGRKDALDAFEANPHWVDSWVVLSDAGEKNLRLSLEEVKRVARYRKDINIAGGHKYWKNAHYETVEEFAETIGGADTVSELVIEDCYRFYAQRKWPELEDLIRKHNLNGNWPPANGGYNIVENVPIKKGMKFDRYQMDFFGLNPNNGLPTLGGTYTSPLDLSNPATFGERALVGKESDYAFKYQIEVLRDLPFTSTDADVIPWHGHPGNGKQNLWEIPKQKSGHPISWNELAEQGYVKVTIVESPSGDYKHFENITF